MTTLYCSVKFANHKISFSSSVRRFQMLWYANGMVRKCMRKSLLGNVLLWETSKVAICLVGERPGIGPLSLKLLRKFESENI
jgi:hypothetical protein